MCYLLLSHCNDCTTRLSVTISVHCRPSCNESPSLVSSRGIKGRCCSNDGLSHYYTMWDNKASPSGRAVLGVGLRSLPCWDYGFEYRRGHRSLSLVSAVCCREEVSAPGRSLVQRSPTECGVCEGDWGSSHRRPMPTRSVQPWLREKVE